MGVLRRAAPSPQPRRHPEHVRRGRVGAGQRAGPAHAPGRGEPGRVPEAPQGLRAGAAGTQAGPVRREVVERTTVWHHSGSLRRVRLALCSATLLAAMVSAPVARALTTPNDPLFLNAPVCTGVTNCVNQQWNLMSDGRGISADSAWDLTKGEGTVIAVIDSGIDYTQPDLMNQI